MISLLNGIYKKRTNEFIYKTKNRLTDFEKLLVTKGLGLGVWDWHMHTEIYRMTGQKRPAV